MQKNKVIAIAVLMLIIGLVFGLVLDSKMDKKGKYGYGKDRGGQMMNKGEFVGDMKGGRQMGSHMMPNGEMMSNGTESMSMADMMQSMNAELQGKTGDAFDQAFLSEMIIHHQGAVEMAQLALTNAKHQEIKDLAKAIIAAQNKEIADMKGWMKAWYQK